MYDCLPTGRKGFLFFLLDNVAAHKTLEVMKNYRFECIYHLPYSPDPGPSDHFPLLNLCLKRRTFLNNLDVTEVEEQYFCDQILNYFLEV